MEWNLTTILQAIAIVLCVIMAIALLFSPFPFYLFIIALLIVIAVLVFKLFTQSGWWPKSRIALFDQIHTADNGKDGREFGIPTRDMIKGSSFDTETFENSRTAKEKWMYYIWLPDQFKFMFILANPHIGTPDRSPLEAKLSIEIRNIPIYRQHIKKWYSAQELTFEQALNYAEKTSKYKNFIEGHNLKNSQRQESEPIAAKNR
ncbi:MAG: hypothetical protein ACRDF4_06205 [Rhabdochlamydiaceae bacterium]